MVCEACDLPVPSRIGDCSLRRAARLAPNTVRRLPVADADAAPLSREKLTVREGARPRSGRSSVPSATRR